MMKLQSTVLSAAVAMTVTLGAGATNAKIVNYDFDITGETNAISMLIRQDLGTLPEDYQRVTWGYRVSGGASPFTTVFEFGEGSPSLFGWYATGPLWNGLSGNGVAPQPVGQTGYYAQNGGGVSRLAIDFGPSLGKFVSAEIAAGSNTIPNPANTMQVFGYDENWNIIASSPLVDVCETGDASSCSEWKPFQLVSGFDEEIRYLEFFSSTNNSGGENEIAIAVANLTVDIPPVPLPMSLPLLAAGLGALGLLHARQKRLA